MSSKVIFLSAGTSNSKLVQYNLFLFAADTSEELILIGAVQKYEIITY